MRILPSFAAAAVFVFAPGCASDTDRDEDPTVDVGEDPPVDEPPTDPGPGSDTPTDSIESLLAAGQERGHLVADALALSVEGMDYRIQLGRGANTLLTLNDVEVRHLAVGDENARTVGVQVYTGSRLAMLDEARADLEVVIRDYSITLYPTWAVDFIQGQGSDDLSELSVVPIERLDRELLELEIMTLARDQIVVARAWSITGDSHPFGGHVRRFAEAIDRHLALAIETLQGQ